MSNLDFNRLRRRAKAVGFYFLRALALLFVLICLIFTGAAALDLSFHLGWGANWQAIPGGLFMAFVGLVFYSFTGLLSPIVDEAMDAQLPSKTQIDD